METLLSAIDPEDLMGIGIAALAILGSLLMGLVAIFAQHQRKMTELFRREVAPQGQQGQIDRLESEVKELKDRINHLILAVEDKSSVRERLAPPEVPDHLRT